MIANNRIIRTGKSSLNKGLVSWHEFNNTSGNTPNEVAASKILVNSGATYNITQIPGNAVGYRTHTAESESTATYTELFNGTNTELTIACWVRFNSTNTANRIFSVFGLHPLDSNIDERSFLFGLNAAGQFRITAYYGNSASNAYHDYATIFAPSVGGLNCMIAHIDVSGPTARMVINGVVVSLSYSTLGSPLSVLNNTSVKPTMGRIKISPNDPGEIQLDADISQLVIWDRKLTTVEESLYYNNGMAIEYKDL